MVEYRFKCKYCKSGFSLEQLRDDHEKECGRMGTQEKAPVSDQPKKMLHCRRCRAEAETIKDLSRHVLEMHREERAALISQAGKRYHADLKKLDAAAGGSGQGAEGEHGGHAAGTAGAQADPPAAEKTARPQRTNGKPNGAACCPTCGGVVPEATAILISALQAEGLAELQAFAAARVARKFLGGARA